MINKIKKKIFEKLFGRDVERMIIQNKIPDPKTSFIRLKKLGFEPKTIFDIGVYEGEFSTMVLDVWPNAKVVGFEALPAKIQLLKKKLLGLNVVIKEAIVGESDSNDISFFADETASSVLYSDEVNTKKSIIKQKMIKLETYIEQEKCSIPNLLKIDTQGYEFNVLKGVEKYLPQIEVVLVELNFIEVYSNVKLAHEVINYLSGFDFVPYDICEIHRRQLDNALFQIDFIFMKKDNKIRKDKRWGLSSNQ